MDGTTKQTNKQTNKNKRGNPDPERQTQYVLTHKWLLEIKQMITPYSL